MLLLPIPLYKCISLRSEYKNPIILKICQHFKCTNGWRESVQSFSDPETSPMAKRNNKNKENTYVVSFSTWTPSNIRGRFLKWNASMDVVRLKGFTFLEAFSHWVSVVLTYTNVYGNWFHRLLLFHNFTLSIHTILF